MVMHRESPANATPYWVLGPSGLGRCGVFGIKRCRHGERHNVRLLGLQERVCGISRERYINALSLGTRGLWQVDYRCGTDHFLPYSHHLRVTLHLLPLRFGVHFSTPLNLSCPPNLWSREHSGVSWARLKCRLCSRELDDPALYLRKLK